MRAIASVWVRLQVKMNVFLFRFCFNDTTRLFECNKHSKHLFLDSIWLQSESNRLLCILCIFRWYKCNMERKIFTIENNTRYQYEWYEGNYRLFSPSNRYVTSRFLFECDSKFRIPERTFTNESVSWQWRLRKMLCQKLLHALVVLRHSFLCK